MRATTLCILTKQGNFLRWPAKIVETKQERERGLSHQHDVTEPLVYLERGQTSLHFQMFDMLVPIDIVFVSAVGKVVASATRFPREEYFYGGNEPVFMVVEMPAGWSDRHKLLQCERMYICDDR